MNSRSTGREQSANSRGAVIVMADYCNLREQRQRHARRVARLTAAAWRAMAAHPCALSWSHAERVARVGEWVAEAVEWRAQVLASRAQ